MQPPPVSYTTSASAGAETNRGNGTDLDTGGHSKKYVMADMLAIEDFCEVGEAVKCFVKENERKRRRAGSSYGRKLAFSRLY
jgi:hypothetical protein